MSPAIGLRHGSNLPPLVLRWCVDDFAAESRRRWTEEGQGLEFDPTMLQLFACADDFYVVAIDWAGCSAHGPTPLLDSMLQLLARDSMRVLGAQIQVDGKHVGHSSVLYSTRPGVAAGFRACDVLRYFHTAESARQQQQFRLIVQIVWAIYHATRPLWLVRCRWKQHIQAVHMSIFPTVGWGAGCRHWTTTEL